MSSLHRFDSRKIEQEEEGEAQAAAATRETGRGGQEREWEREQVQVLLHSAMANCVLCSPLSRSPPPGSPSAFLLSDPPGRWTPAETGDDRFPFGPHTQRMTRMPYLPTDVTGHPPVYLEPPWANGRVFFCNFVKSKIWRFLPSLPRKKINRIYTRIKKFS